MTLARMCDGRYWPAQTRGGGRSRARPRRTSATPARPHRLLRRQWPQGRVGCTAARPGTTPSRTALRGNVAEQTAGGLWSRPRRPPGACGPGERPTGGRARCRHRCGSYAVAGGAAPRAHAQMWHRPLRKDCAPPRRAPVTEHKALRRRNGHAGRPRWSVGDASRPPPRPQGDVSSGLTHSSRTATHTDAHAGTSKHAHTRGQGGRRRARPPACCTHPSAALGAGAPLRGAHLGEDHGARLVVGEPTRGLPAGARALRDALGLARLHAGQALQDSAGGLAPAQ